MSHHKTSAIDWRVNNFDLIRLFGAVQVVLHHCAIYLHVPPHSLHKLLQYFPGVPIFFFVSGFLISAAWERDPDIGAFVRNRALRIFPAYWFQFLVSAAVVLWLAGPHLEQLLLWSAAQLTLLNDWNPGWLRGHGTGVANGALWTIPVELCFYAATPLVYRLFRRTGRPDAVLIVIMAIALAIAAFAMLAAGRFGQMTYMIVDLSPLPWIGMFALGMLAQRHKVRLIALVRGRFWLCLALYVAICLVSNFRGGLPLLGFSANYIGAVNYICLCGLILSAAFSAPSLAQRLLRRNDFSYGIYLFHMPMMNVALGLGLAGYRAMAAVMAGASVMAVLSWFMVERRSLRAKVRPLYPREPAKTASNLSTATVQVK